MKAYIYNADIYCEDCAEDIKRQIRQEAKAAGKSVKEYLEIGDSSLSDAGSDAWPQGPHEDGGGEADSPQHCGSHESCLNAIMLKDGSKVGMFLKNPLTSYGRDYVQGVLHEAIRKGDIDEVVNLWATEYEFIIEVEMCKVAGTHLVSCDDDGYCEECGHQEE